MTMPLVDYPSSPSSTEDDRDAKNAENISPSPPIASRVALKRKRESVSRDNNRVTAAHSNELPPLPLSFHDLYASSTRTSTHDDPSLHGGRTRGIPHVEGNWPSHVYLEWYPSPSETEHLNCLIKTIESCFRLDQSQRKLHSLLETDLATPRPLHISLSRPLNLETGQRHSFAESLASSIHNFGAGHLRNSRVFDEEQPRQAHRVSPFTTRLTALDWAANETRTRWFSVLRIAKPEGNMLNQLLAACNMVSKSFGLGELYLREGSTGGKRHAASVRNDSTRRKKSEDAADAVDCTDFFHFSIAWILEEPTGNVSTEKLRVLEQNNVSFRNALEGLRKIELRFDAVKVKIGNEITSIALSDTVEKTDRGILG